MLLSHRQHTHSTCVSIHCTFPVTSQIDDRPQQAFSRRRCNMLALPVLKQAIVCSLLICGVRSFAQTTQIPFEQIQKDAGATVMQASSNSDIAAVSAPEPALGDSSSATPPLPASSSPALTPSSAAFTSGATVPRPKIVDKKFVLLNTMHLALALADVELSQRCIDQHTCAEANPFMPSSHAGKLEVSFGIFAYGAGASYFLKKHNSRWWWLSPVLGSGLHTVGIASALSH